MDCWENSNILARKSSCMDHLYYRRSVFLHAQHLPPPLITISIRPAIECDRTTTATSRRKRDICPTGVDCAEVPRFPLAHDRPIRERARAMEPMEGEPISCSHVGHNSQPNSNETTNRGYTVSRPLSHGESGGA